MWHWWVVLIFLLYLGLLFGLAFLAERGREGKKNWLHNRFNYALSLTVYCTAWTFMGSVGKAANDGLSFLPIYLGPLILAPVWPYLIRKMIRISKAERLTSVADFVSSRYGKNRLLGALTAIFLVIAVVPYISIQLKAIASIFDLLIKEPATTSASGMLYPNSALLLTLILAVFIGIYGVRKLDPNEKHQGVITAISFEAIFKLVAFLVVGLWVAFQLTSGQIGNLEQAMLQQEVSYVWSLSANGMTAFDWFWLNLVSMCAWILLPRQFHVSVVENDDPKDVGRAAWIYPLYLLLINLFVLPIAIGGLLFFGLEGMPVADTFVISLPLQMGAGWVGLMAALGGFAAATGMVIMSTIALSLMIGNNIVLPYLLEFGHPSKGSSTDLSKPLLSIRRLIILLVLLLSYGYYQGVAERYSLVATGLVSFVGVAQLAPLVIGGLYWQEANRKGAMVGLICGGCMWIYTLVLPNLLETSAAGLYFIENGPAGISFLSPHELFGFDGVNPIAHGAFWSILANLAGLVIGSLTTTPNTIDVRQADFFVNNSRYHAADESFKLRPRRAIVGDLQRVLGRFTGPNKAQQLMADFGQQTGQELSTPGATASPQLINFVEQQLGGAIGTASAQVLLRGITREDPIQLEEVITILQQTRAVVRYGRDLERKQQELEELTLRLRRANQRLKELDQLKEEFVATVTHELRTPITSIKSLASILLETPELTQEKRTTFLKIIVSESERLTRLVNQVLDLQSLEAEPGQLAATPVDMVALARSIIQSMQTLATEKGVTIELQLKTQPLWVNGPEDRLTQVLVNLLANAIKFVPENEGRVELIFDRIPPNVHDETGFVQLCIRDNGPGIPAEQSEFIFDRFTQLSTFEEGKPSGSGLGLHISRKIAERYGGGLYLDAAYRSGAAFILSLPQWEQNDELNRDRTEADE